MSNSSSRTLKIHPNFKMIFWAVAGFTLLSICIMSVLSLYNPEAKTMAEVPILQKNLYEICRFGWQSGFGAIIGLIGGNVSSQ